MKNKLGSINKRYSLIAALQAGAAYDYAILKSRRQFKHEASDKKAYEPGTLGLSMVSKEIQKEYGGIMNRAGRKLLAKTRREARPRFYNI
ncbi:MULTISPECIES: hypothetical protein [unclassified Paenibacillus]|uniref:hypothetical protein n=1 Tax=unclassified Paenibacillus TaxID=185978 RepID=UPI0024070708|nr:MULTISPECIES: hypothetical protein [unclassified Paenibacillus]MDF9844185.1 hypothetical protein [Paenibacillus sp. PastF-2]MDF9850693.1 hypothetical protein [Paenibacillus sp. PastM-2]MDF9857264.1 hypothetical protein [Paenibacillus sp. PastF-1]MDH6482628.1 hypothetical protein [Paenibacillus sp. PastH-2]MDH6510055.1 hypothetical protein [Paenibacillus sp. PastM-3]